MQRVERSRCNPSHGLLGGLAPLILVRLVHQQHPVEDVSFGEVVRPEDAHATVPHVNGVERELDRRLACQGLVRAALGVVPGRTMMPFNMG